MMKEAPYPWAPILLVDDEPSWLRDGLSFIV